MQQGEQSGGGVPMKDYLVRHEIEVSATDPQAAAREGFTLMRGDKSGYTEATSVIVEEQLANGTLGEPGLIDVEVLRQSKLRTIREVLEPFGVDCVIDSWEGRLLAVEIDDYGLGGSKGTGFLQCSCGGDMIMWFHPAGGLRREIFLVRDDRDGESWDAARQRGENPVATRPRPHAKLVLVQTG